MPPRSKTIKILPDDVIKYIMGKFGDYIKDNDFEQFYDEVIDQHTLEETGIISKFLYMDCDINFLRYMNRVPAGCFFGCESLQRIDIPQTVKEINEVAFDYCKNLEYVGIPNSVKVIRHAAFGNCPKLKEITIPESVTHMGDGVFNHTYAIIKCKKDSFIDKWASLNNKSVIYM